MLANVAFLRGALSRAPYHRGPVAEETIPLVQKLIQINAHGFISVSGQPATCKHAEQETADEGAPTSHNQSGVVFGDTEQKSYLQGFLHENYLADFVTFIQSQPCFYQIRHRSPNLRVLCGNFPASTRDYTVTRVRSHPDPEQLSTVPWTDTTVLGFDSFTDGCDEWDHIWGHFSTLKRICAEECVSVFLAGREYGQGPLMEDVLLSFFDKAPVMIQLDTTCLHGIKI